MNPFGSLPNFFSGQQNVPQNFVFNPNLPPPPMNLQPQNGNRFNTVAGFNGQFTGAPFNNAPNNNFNNQFSQNFRHGSHNNFRTGNPMNNNWSHQHRNPRNGRAVNNIWSQPQDYQASDKQFNNKNRQNHGHGGNGSFKNNWQHHGNKNYNQNNMNKKVKVDKRDLPENNAYYCDACDRGFKTEQIYTEHVNLHQKCSGCGYIAAPKLVKLHYDLQHRTGLAKKIWSLETKEDLEKWINERKKNYPTPSNIARKNQVLQEKRERGEVLETKQFGKMKGRGRKERNMKRRTDNETNSTEVKRIKEEPVLEHPDPMAMLLTQQPQEISTNGAEKAEVEQLNGLTCLMACYGGEDSDSDTSEKDKETNTESTHITAADIKSETRDAPEDLHSHNENNNNCDEVNNMKVEEDEDNNNVKNNKRKRKRGRKQKNNQTQASSDNKQMKKHQSTLLEMLLAKEIRHERNVILQCVHYIVRKNFFNQNSN